MPQMSPLLWLVLFVYFLVVFMFYIINIYFTFTPLNYTSESCVSKGYSSLNWSW